MINTNTVFPSWVVTPINSLDQIPKAFNPGPTNFSSWSSPGSNRHPGNSDIVCSLQQAEVISKRVYLVPLDIPVAQKDYESYLAQYGLKPCKYGINYLLALMNDLNEIEIPEEIKTSIIALDPNSIGLAADNGNHLYMYVRRGKYRRVLSVGTVTDPLPIPLAVIAEKM